MKEVILVDSYDNELGLCEKYKAHVEGLLHRAFSVFVFNRHDELIMQKRASAKYHSPDLWTNTCCSHQIPGKNLKEISQKRLKEEMGIDCDLEKTFETQYRLDCGGGMIEHEYNHVLIGYSDSVPVLNEKEASDFKMVSLKTIETHLGKTPENFTEWFKVLFPLVKSKMLLRSI